MDQDKQDLDQIDILRKLVQDYKLLLDECYDVLMEHCLPDELIFKKLRENGIGEKE